MASRNFKVKNGDEIIVKLAGKTEREKPRPKKPPQKSSGIVQARREEDYLARRKSGVFVNFWDLGQEFDAETGTWKDLDWRFPANLALGAGIVSGIDDFGADGWESLKTKILSVPRDDFHTHFRKIEYVPEADGFDLAARYGLDLTMSLDFDFDSQNHYTVSRNNSRYKVLDFLAQTPIADTTWQAKGLKVKNPGFPNPITPVSNAAFYIWNVVDNSELSNVVQTQVPEYGTDYGAYSLTKSIDVFLVPRPAFVYLIAEDTDNKHYLGLYFKFFSRELFLENNVPTTATNAFMNAAQIIVENPTAGEMSAILNHIEAETGARYYHAVFNEGTGEYDGIYKSPAEFPAWGAGGLTFRLEITNTGTGIGAGDVANCGWTPGALLALIKKGGEWFYVWSRVSSIDNGPTLIFEAV